MEAESNFTTTRIYNVMKNHFMYDITPHIAEIYDQTVNQYDDVQLIQKLIGDSSQLRILEAFCGTGRLLIPLAIAGHHVVGLDKALGMLSRAKAKVENLDKATQSRISLFETDVLQGEWTYGEFDLVILGGNCFYELSTPEEQKKCIMNASSILKHGGYIH
jgi:SAM-dependent methyltransferase